MGNILITGATGNVGLELARILSPNPDAIAAVRKLDEGQKILGSGARCRVFDFSDPGTWLAAFANVDRLFLMRPPAISNVRRFIFPVIDAAQTAGVRHVVFLSLQGAEEITVTPHAKIEKYLQRKPMACTFLRPSFFMQNLSTTHRDEIRNQGEIFVPAGRGKTSFVDVRDVAAVAAKVLTENGHEGGKYELTGSQALDYGEVAGIFTSVLGRKITYARPSLPRFYFHLRRRGIVRCQALVMSAIYTVARLGKAGRVTGEVQRLLGKSPITMEQFVRDHRGVWEQSTK